MKAIKVILGSVFGLATVWYVLLTTYLARAWAMAGYSRQAFTQTGGGIACVCICATLTVLAFRSAFRKPTLKPARRWYQFSLRSLLLFGPPAAICISWLVLAERELAQKDTIRTEIVTAILKSGGVVPSWQLDVSGPCCWVSLRSDAGLKYLASVPHLEDFECDALNLEGPQVTDAGLEYIKAWPQLQCLTLRNTCVTGSGLQHLQALPQLRHIMLFRTGVNAASLEYLKEVPTLESLCLNGTAITDAHLQHLKACLQLKTLTLVDTSVTDQGIRDLHAALPTCKIDH